MIPKNNILTLMVIAVLFFLTMIILCFSLIQSLQSNRSLQRQLKFMENLMELEIDQNMAKLDSLEKIINFQDQQNHGLKDQLLEYKLTKLANNKRSDEKKTAISRIHSVDSLYHEIARHYR